MVHDSVRIRPLIVSFLFIVVFIAGSFIRVASLRMPSERTEDESVYYFYSSNVSTEGLLFTRELVHGYNRRENFWVFPPPIRVGYIYMVAAVMRFVGSTDLFVLAQISCFFSILSLILIFAAGLRYMNVPSALIATAFLASSPMDLALARRAWQDGVVGFFGFLMMCLCFEISLRPKNKMLFSLFWTLSAFSLLLKESLLIVYVLCSLWILSILILKEKNIKKTLKFASIGLFVPVFSLASIAFASGGFSEVVLTLSNTSSSVANNTYAVLIQSGPWFYAWEAFFLLSPLTSFFSVLALVLIAKSFVYQIKKPRSFKTPYPLFTYFLLFFILFITFFSAIPEYLKNIRFLSAMYYPIFLTGAFGLWESLCFARKRLKILPASAVYVFCFLLVCTAMFLDLANFSHIFIENEVKDPVNILLRNHSIYRRQN